MVDCFTVYLIVNLVFYSSSYETDVGTSEQWYCCFLQTRFELRFRIRMIILPCVRPAAMPPPARVTVYSHERFLYFFLIKCESIKFQSMYIWPKDILAKGMQVKNCQICTID